MNNLLKSLALSAALLSATSCQSQKLGDYINKANDEINKNTGKGGGGSLSNSEVVSGMKQALEVGTKNASGRLSALNGYFGNQLIKILMPPEAKKVESALRAVGAGSLVDKAIMSMNRAAEGAATKAVPIIVNAITSMSIQDGISILRGGNGAATNFLKGRTTTQLTSAFRPVIDASLAKVGATKYWGEVFTAY